MNAEDIINILNLVPLPEEGGFFRETYKSTDILKPGGLPGRFEGERSASTAIYYLLTPESFSALHRLPIDEVFHFYLGDPVEILQLLPDKTFKTTILGNNLEKGQVPQVVVEKNIWQGSRLIDGGKFALLGTTVAPGFEFEDMEIADCRKLIEEYPAAEEKIKQLTPK